MVNIRKWSPLAELFRSLNCCNLPRCKWWLGGFSLLGMKSQDLGRNHWFIARDEVLSTTANPSAIWLIFSGKGSGGVETSTVLTEVYPTRLSVCREELPSCIVAEGRDALSGGKESIEMTRVPTTYSSCKTVLKHHLRHTCLAHPRDCLGGSP